MKIYHGSLEVIERPLILQPNRLLDYGKGFYTTTSERQAKEWVERRMIEKTQPVVMSTYMSLTKKN